MIFLLFIQSLWAESLFCQKDLIGENHSKIESSIETKISRAANLVTIAKEADKALAHLLATKNRILIDWLKERRLMEAKEEVIASNWRRYYLEEFILKKFPTPHPGVNRSVENLFSQINKITFTVSVQKRISTLFKKARSETVRQIQSWSIDKKSKKEVIHRLNKVKLNWFKKLRKTVFQNKPLEFLNKSLVYDSKLNQINVGVPILRYPNDESLFGAFLQTLAQALNPDKWSVFFKEQNPFGPVQSCLKKSFGTSDKQPVQKIFTYWFSAEIFAKSAYLKGNSRMNLCNKSFQNQNLLEQIYGAQPQIKKKLDLKNKNQYCPLGHG